MDDYCSVFLGQVVILLDGEERSLAALPASGGGASPRCMGHSPGRCPAFGGWLRDKFNASLARQKMCAPAGRLLSLPLSLAAATHAAAFSSLAAALLLFFLAAFFFLFCSWRYLWRRLACLGAVLASLSGSVAAVLTRLDPKVRVIGHCASLTAEVRRANPWCRVSIPAASRSLSPVRT